MQDPVTTDLDHVWRALSNPVRRRILDDLRDGPRATGELADAVPELSRFAVMQHLKVLEEGDLVIRRKQGRTVTNYLNPVPIQQIYHRWVKRYEGAWAEALVGLKRQVEEDEHPDSRGMTA